MSGVASGIRFERPPGLDATRPPELSGRARDEVRLLLSRARGHTHHRFRDLPRLLRPGDLLVVNDSATLPASLTASLPAARRGAAGARNAAGNALGDFVLNLSTRYADTLWLAEPRYAYDRPGPLPLRPGDVARLGGAGGTDARFIAPHAGLGRLWFVATAEPLERVMRESGRPIRYGYVGEAQPLEAYQTVFARVPGSAEMPSAARPFSARVLADLAGRGVGTVPLTLHTGVSSLETGADEPSESPLFAEPFDLPPSTAAAINAARSQGRRVIAVGTTVVRALETTFDGRHVHAGRGFTRRFVRPGHGGGSVDGLLTGLHAAGASHLAMLAAVAGADLVRDAYRAAVEERYLWHEFGDVHLLLPPRAVTA